MRQTIKAMLGAGAASDEARSVAADAMRTYTRALADMPARSAVVETLVATFARHAALNAYWTAKACAVGIGTAEGVAFTREALAHGQRAERLAVTAIDVSTRLAKREGAGVIDLDAINAQAERETEERRERERARQRGER